MKLVLCEGNLIWQLSDEAYFELLNDISKSSVRTEMSFYGVKVGILACDVREMGSEQAKMLCNQR